MANVTVANTSANVSGKTLLTAENSYTVAGLYTFSRSPSAPFAVQASSANVTNLDADLLDGEHATAIHAAANITGSHTLPDGVLSTNVPLLNATANFASGLSALGNMGVGTASPTALNITKLLHIFGSAAATGIRIEDSGGVVAELFCGGASLQINTVGAASPMTFGINNAAKWGINANGDFTFGASSHLALSSGTPTISSGGGTGASITGTDYGFIVTVGTSPGSANIVINYGHTYTSAPAAVGSIVLGSIVNNNFDGITTSTTQCTINGLSGNWNAGDKITVITHGF